MPQDRITIRGARQHNLKDIDLDLPRDRMIVITGISGSGKSSLAFDTLYAEGQRRYVESLSAYARQFLGQMDKPDVDHIEGLSPAVSIDQKSTSRNPRSTVGTVTEIYDYLRLLFARIGHPHCPQCGREIAQQTVEQIVDRVLELPEGTRIQILAPVVKGRKGEYRKEIEQILQEGYTRVRIDGSVYDLGEEPPPDLDRYKQHWIDIVVDRLVVRADMGMRLTDSLETALKKGDGVVTVLAVRRGEAAAVPPPPGPGRVDAAVPPPPNPRPPEGRGNSGDDAAVRHSPDPGLPEGRGNSGAEEEMIFSEQFACSVCGISVDEIAPRTFSFNSPYGACPDCHGLGTKTEFDPDKIIPDRSRSLQQGALTALMPKTPGANYGNYLLGLLAGVGEQFGFTLDTPIEKLKRDQFNALMYGVEGNVTVRFRNRFGRVRTFDSKFSGAVNMLQRRYDDTTSEWIREELNRYRSTRPCPKCEGTRLKPEALAVTVNGWNIAQMTALSIAAAHSRFGALELTPRETAIARQIVKEIRARLTFLVNVGLDYLTLDRGAATLAGGEAQRIRLATQIGSGLMGVLYILDEPSIGLHQRDNAKLIDTLLQLRDLGNTIIVVEHDEETMRAADHIVDIGPGAGEHGGRVVAQGTLDEIMATEGSVTGQYLSGKRRIPTPLVRRPLPEGFDDTVMDAAAQRRWIELRGARAHNLKGIDVRIPLGSFVCVTGVSGSGKSTLVQETLLPRLMSKLHGSLVSWAPHDDVTGLEHVDKVIDIDQSPIGRTPRSNPATYTGAFDLIRDLFAATQEARVRGYMPGRFSFNVKGGRCEACRGDGIIKIEMHFLPDVYVPCEICKGRRYNRETLEVRYKDRSIADVLDMTVSEAVEFFGAVPRICRKFATLHDVGLDYIRLGQPATTLSGGEAQRIKLAAELSRRGTGRTLYILDEPTTGLHMADIEKLLEVLGRLVDAGNTVLVIEHNLDVIKTADYIIDLGPEGGDAGGQVIATGTPEQVAETPGSHTGYFLRRVLAAR